MAWSSNRTWIAGEDLTAALLNTYLRDQLDETAPAIATAAGRLIVTDAANSITERIPTTAYVATSETTASASYTDLATVGPSVTVTTGTLALVLVQCRLANSVAAGQSVATVDVSGATTIAPAVARGLWYESSNAGDLLLASSSSMFDSLTAGSNTFTLKYRTTGTGTSTFDYRRISVIPF